MNQTVSDGLSQYLSEYQRSVEYQNHYWLELARSEIEWFTTPTQGLQHNTTEPSYTWFADGTLNISHNCLDRHVRDGHGAVTALVWQDETGQEQRLSYQQLLAKVCQTAQLLVQLGVQQGDRVTIYMPLSPEQVAVMLACARIGAMHNVVFAGFSATSLADRIADAASQFLFVTDVTLRRGKEIKLLATARQAVTSHPTVQVIVHRRNSSTELQEGELDFEQQLQKQPATFAPVPLPAETPLFMLYTSGTTGKPKGIVHTTGGYNLYTHYTSKRVFHLRRGTKYWCTADCGWITGHSYVVYGPLSNGATVYLVEGAPDYPAQDRWWQIVEHEEIEVLYTAPTAVRMLMQHGNELPEKHDLSSLKIIGSVGEPINQEAWHWLDEVIGGTTAAVVDTWWQTETGGHLLVTLPELPQKPGKAGLPFFGCQPVVVNTQGQEVAKGEKGYLAIREPWPGALRSCWQNHSRFAEYWQQLHGLYFSGDMAVQDTDGYVQVLGRADDVISVAGHRIGSAELEEVLTQHAAVTEAAVIGVPDDIKGERVIAFVIVVPQAKVSEAQLQAHVRTQYAAHGVPSEIQFVSSLPKTRSGKIMRRLLKSQITGEQLADTSTLEE